MRGKVRGHCARGGRSDRCDETIATLGQCLDEARIVCGISQRFPDFVDGAGEGALKVYGGVCTPDLPLQFLAGDDLAGPCQQRRENGEGLACKPDLVPGFPEFSCMKVDFEQAERDSIDLLVYCRPVPPLPFESYRKLRRASLTVNGMGVSN